MRADSRHFAFFLWGRRLAGMRWDVRLRTLADECWRAAQLVVFFVIAGLLFSAPPQLGIFTPAVYDRGAADQARPPIARATFVVPDGWQENAPPRSPDP